MTPAFPRKRTDSSSLYFVTVKALDAINTTPMVERARILIDCSFRLTFRYLELLPSLFGCSNMGRM